MLEDTQPCILFATEVLIHPTSVVETKVYGVFLKDLGWKTQGSIGDFFIKRYIDLGIDVYEDVGFEINMAGNIIRTNIIYNEDNVGISFAGTMATLDELPHYSKFLPPDQLSKLREDILAAGYSFVEG